MGFTVEGQAEDLKIRTRLRDEADQVAVAQSHSRLQRLRQNYVVSVDAETSQRRRSSRREAHQHSLLDLLGLTDYGLAALAERKPSHPRPQ